MSITRRYFVPETPIMVMAHVKTTIPRSLDTIPQLPNDKIYKAYILRYPHVKYVTSAAIWLLRKTEGDYGFMMWYLQATQARMNDNQFRRQLDAFEKWYTNTPRPSDEELILSLTGQVPYEHSGWLVDVPGLNPQRGENYYMRLFGVNNTYDFVEKFKSHEQLLRPLIQHQSGENVMQVMNFVNTASTALGYV